MRGHWIGCVHDEIGYGGYMSSAFGFGGLMDAMDFDECDEEIHPSSNHATPSVWHTFCGLYVWSEVGAVIMCTQIFDFIKPT